MTYMHTFMSSYSCAYAFAIHASCLQIQALYLVLYKVFSCGPLLQQTMEHTTIAVLIALAACGERGELSHMVRQCDGLR